MTGQDIQDKLGQIVTDLQTTAKGKTAQIAFRQNGGNLAIFPLSSDVNGVVQVGQLEAIQDFLDDGIKDVADAFETASVPVKATSEAFRLQRATHQTAIDAASAAREALNAELEADDLYQDAKTDYEAASTNPVYISARNDYQSNFVSENYGNLSDARGTYI